MKNSVNKAVPSAVVSSTANSVPVNDEAILGPYEPMKGSSIVPEVPRTEVDGQIPAAPYFSGGGANAGTFMAGSKGAPSVPTDGFLFRAGPIDDHYRVEAETCNPYSKVNNPPTRGMWTRIQMFINGIARSQDVDNTGFNVRVPQQRTSVMRNALPPHGMGYNPETATPRIRPQAVPFNRIQPVTGSDRYGSGVLNSDTFGAGQTAGGIGGSNYTPQPGPPPTNSITVPADNSGMPSWG